MMCAIELVLYPLLVIVSLSGVLIGRWWALLIPWNVWPIYFLGVGMGLWGHGLGDGWQYGFLLVVAISLAAVAIGVGLRVLPRRDPTEHGRAPG
jgi:hypothetical protein